jgi:hypothetical protein
MTMLTVEQAITLKLELARQIELLLNGVSKATRANNIEVTIERINLIGGQREYQVTVDLVL